MGGGAEVGAEIGAVWAGYLSALSLEGQWEAELKWERK